MEHEAAALAAGALSEALAKIETSDHPAYVEQLVGAYRGSVREALTSGEQLRADREELRAKADLLPPAGAARLEREAKAEAEARSKDAMQKARIAAESLRRAALLDAQPKPNKEREVLGREELSMLVGNGSAAQIMAAIHRVAERGSRDAVAALGSDFGRALIESRGLVGRDLDDALSSARKVIVETAETNKARHTPAELRAARLWKSVGELDAATAAASFALGTAGISHA
jgi:hypothetical protein